MQKLCDLVNPCTTLGHVYSNVTVVFCEHLGATTVIARSWLDSDYDDPIEIYSSTIELGPFDSPDEVTDQALDACRAAIASVHRRDR